MILKAISLQGSAGSSRRAIPPSVLVNEVRSELKGSIVAWVCLAAASALLALHFAPIAHPARFGAWLAAILIFLACWLAAWVRFLVRPPSDAAILKFWIPGAKTGMLICNLTTAGGVWVFLPVAQPELHALLIVLFAQYLSVQFAAASEATQVLASAVVMVLGSLAAWLWIEQPPYYLWQIAGLLLFGATLVLIRRFVREAVVNAARARASAEAKSASLGEALAELQRERETDAPPPPPATPEAAGLSRRQAEVLALMSEGLTNREIAHRLGISAATVKIHVARVIEALEAANRTDAVARAQRARLV